MTDRHPTGFISVHITAADIHEAETIARALVDDRLAACVNILPPMQSIYRWQGRVETAQEILLIVKTQEALFDALAAKVTGLHSYDCPCIVALPLLAGNEPYLRWVGAETGTGDAMPLTFGSALPPTRPDQ